MFFAAGDRSWGPLWSSIMPFNFSLSDVIPESAREIYDAWLDSDAHTRMTGGQPARISAEPGAKFTAWNEYMSRAKSNMKWSNNERLKASP